MARRRLAIVPPPAPDRLAPPAPLTPEEVVFLRFLVQEAIKRCMAK